MLISTIIDLVLKEARVDKLALLQEQQINNMVGQFFAKNKTKFSEDKVELAKGKKTFTEYAKKFNEIIKKLKIDFKNEKLLLIWLLEQVLENHISANKIEEDSKVIEENLELYFKNKGEIKKNIYKSSYSDLKIWIMPFKKGGEEAQYEEFLSKPAAEGNDYKIYKVTSVDQCIKIGKGTSWCIQGDTWAKSYLKKGPLWLVTKNDKRFALIQFESDSFMDINDHRLDNQIIMQILQVWPEAQKIILQTFKHESNLINFLDEKTQEEVIEANPEVIKDIEKPTKNVQLKAVSINGKLIKHIENPSVDVQMAAINSKWVALSFIKNPDKTVVKRAIERDPRAAEFA
jgi:hypothetical protein